MAITDKSRKTLWARSGNRCAMCRAELVAERNELNKNLNIGDECHIISEKTGGPRYVSDYTSSYDDYDNLILLCKNHHRTIDELYETYTVELLRTIKSNHENWVRITLDIANNKTKKNPIQYLPRIRTGKQLVDIIKEAHAFQFDHDEFKTQEETDLISGFLQNLQDCGDLSSFSGMEIGQMSQLGFELNGQVKEIEEADFLIFGERKISRMTNDKKEDLGIWDIAVIVVLRKDNSAIIDLEKIAAQFRNDNK